MMDVKEKEIYVQRVRVDEEVDRKEMKKKWKW